MKRRADKGSRVSKVREGAIDRLFLLKGRSDHLLGKQSGNLVETWRKVMKASRAVEQNERGS